MTSKNIVNSNIYIRKNGSFTNIVDINIINDTTYRDTTLNVDFSEGDNIEVYADGSDIENPVVVLFLSKTGGSI